MEYLSKSCHTLLTILSRVIYCQEFMSYLVEKLAEELADQRVVRVEKVSGKSDGVSPPRDTFHYF